jgi:hypothetical protein
MKNRWFLALWKAPTHLRDVANMAAKRQVLPILLMLNELQDLYMEEYIIEARRP